MKKLRIIADRVLSVIKSFRPTERLFFFFFFILFSVSLIYFLLALNNAFLVTVPSSGGTLEEGEIGYPRYINPILAITDPGRDLVNLIYAGLMRQDSDGNLVPELAKSYSVSSDGLTYDFILKDNLTFQDGRPLTTDDVEYTVEKAADPALKSPKAANWQGVTVEKVSSTEIKFHLKKPYGPFLENTTIGILPKNLWQQALDADTFALSDLNRNPVGAGPYFIKSIETNSAGLPQYYLLSPFKNYALGEAYIANIIVRFYPSEESLLAAYNRGEIKAINSIPPSEIEYIKSRNTNIVTIPLPRIFGVFFNQTQHPILIHPEVRQALDLAVDRDRIINEVFGGYAKAEDTPIPENLLEYGTTSSSTIADADRADAALAILTKAGWSLGSDNLMHKTTKKVTETLHLTISTSDSPDLLAVAKLLSEMWQKIGVGVDIETYNNADLNQDIIRPRKYEALLFGEIIPPGLDVFGFWHSSERNDPGLNLSLYASTKADKLLETARTSSDQRVTEDNLRKFEDEVAKDDPAVFLYSPDFIYAVPKNLRGLLLGQITVPADRFNNVKDWYLETEKVWRLFAKK